MIAMLNSLYDLIYIILFTPLAYFNSRLMKKDPVRHLVSLQVLSPAVTVPKSRKAVALECGPRILASVYVSGLTALA